MTRAIFSLFGIAYFSLPSTTAGRAVNIKASITSLADSGTCIEYYLSSVEYFSVVNGVTSKQQSGLGSNRADQASTSAETVRVACHWC